MVEFATLREESNAMKRSPKAQAVSMRQQRPRGQQPRDPFRRVRRLDKQGSGRQPGNRSILESNPARSSPATQPAGGTGGVESQVWLHSPRGPAGFHPISIIAADHGWSCHPLLSGWRGRMWMACQLARPGSPEQVGSGGYPGRPPLSAGSQERSSRSPVWRIWQDGGFLDHVPCEPVPVAHPED